MWMSRDQRLGPALAVGPAPAVLEADLLMLLEDVVLAGVTYELRPVPGWLIVVLTT